MKKEITKRLYLGKSPFFANDYCIYIDGRHLANIVKVGNCFSATVPMLMPTRYLSSFRKAVESVREWKQEQNDKFGDNFKYVLGNRSSVIGRIADRIERNQ